jgi:hypothetical protein
MAAAGASSAFLRAHNAIYVSSYYYMRTHIAAAGPFSAILELILLYMYPHTTI